MCDDRHTEQSWAPLSLYHGWLHLERGDLKGTFHFKFKAITDSILFSLSLYLVKKVFSQFSK